MIFQSIVFSNGNFRLFSAVDWEQAKVSLSSFIISCSFVHCKTMLLVRGFFSMLCWNWFYKISQIKSFLVVEHSLNFLNFNAKFTFLSLLKEFTAGEKCVSPKNFFNFSRCPLFEFGSCLAVLLLVIVQVPLVLSVGSVGISFHFFNFYALICAFVLK